MKLLDAKKIEVERISKEEKLKENIRKLNKEESASVKRLNMAKESESAEKKRISEDITLAQDEGKAAIKKSILLQEIKVLELQKAEALKPIDEIKTEAESLLEYARKINSDSKKTRLAVDDSIRDVADRINLLIDQEESAIERDLDLNKREERIKWGEDELVRSTKSLGQEWVKFHIAVNAQNKNIERREKEVADQKKSNKDIRQEIEVERKRIADADVAVQDKYKALEQAKKHLGIK